MLHRFGNVCNDWFGARFEQNFAPYDGTHPVLDLRHHLVLDRNGRVEYGAVRGDRLGRRVQLMLAALRHRQLADVQHQFIVLIIVIPSVQIALFDHQQWFVDFLHPSLQYMMANDKNLQKGKAYF